MSEVNKAVEEKPKEVVTYHIPEYKARRLLKKVLKSRARNNNSKRSRKVNRKR